MKINLFYIAITKTLYMAFCYQVTEHGNRTLTHTHHNSMTNINIHQ